MDRHDEIEGYRGAISFPAGNDDFREARNICARACRRFNETPEDAPPEIRIQRWFDIVRRISPDDGGEDDDDDDDTDPAVTGEMTFRDPSLRPRAPFVKPPIHMDYGLRVRVGGTSFINRYCMIMDTPVADVVVGERCSVGPHCTIVAVAHPLAERERTFGRRGSAGSSVRIGDGVWIGAGVTILGGVTIGNGAVIGAGSLVTRDVPPRGLAYGVPARLGRILAEDEVTPVAGSVETLAEALAVGVWGDDDDDDSDDGETVSYQPVPTDSRGKPVEWIAQPVGTRREEEREEDEREEERTGGTRRLSRVEVVAGAALVLSFFTSVALLAVVVIESKRPAGRL